MTLNNIWLKVARIFRKLKRRIEMGIPFSLARTNRANVQEYIREYATATGVVSDIHADDLIFRFLVENPVFKTIDLAIKYYFDDGQKSAKKLNNLLFSQLGVKRSADTTLLEFASGYGCVTRQLIRELSPINIVSCDIHVTACSFINSAMDVETILSARIPEDLEIASNSFDVVFALSFFSHMPDHTWTRWLKILFDKVTPGGFLIFTTQGMISRKYFGYPVIPENGFWFIPSSEQKDLSIADYGNTIVTATYVKKAVEDILHQNLLHISEGFWWEHQDLYVIRKLMPN